MTQPGGPCRRAASDGQATQLLLDSTNGDADAADALFALVYDHLRRLARSLFHWSGSPHVLDPTELVHEAYLKLIRQDAVGAVERTHFFASLRA
ncbi:MAG: hypothetical protein CMJ58_03255 [Planctomycetaceae bacterium]|nr:hypothetical protein [Planctomycetaceae bacterium]